MWTTRGRVGRGFTLIELMIVVAIVGVLAALATVAVAGYLRHAKTAEVHNALGQLAKDAKGAYDRELVPAAPLEKGTSATVSSKLCASATSAVPADVSMVKGSKYQSNPASGADWMKDWATPGVGFTCLRFGLTDPQYYMYSYEADVTAGFTAMGNGDLDGDGVTSTFVMRGSIVSSTVLVSPNLEETLADE